MGRIQSLALTSLLIAGVGFSQDSDTGYHHNDVVFGVGPAIPVGNTTNYLSTVPLIDCAYGYRFNRLFQADAGLQIAFGAANNQNVEVTNFGTVQGGDHEFMVPLGGRVYIPQPFKRFDVSAGGGTAYNFHVGTTFQYVVASTNGQAVGNVPALKTTDHWMNILFEFGLSF